MYLDAFTELARDHDLTLYANILAGCPWQTGLRHLGHTPQMAAACQEARATFYDQVLPSLNLDRIIVVTLSRSEGIWRKLLSDTDRPSQRPLRELQRDHGEQTLELIRATGARVTFVHSTPGTRGYHRSGPDPLECLETATTLGECAIVIPGKQPFVDAYYDQWAQQPGVDTADFTPAYCPDGPVCRPVLGGRVVWKDPDHIAAQLLRARRALIWEALQ